MDRDRTEVVVFDPAGLGAVGNVFALTDSNRLISFNVSSLPAIATNAAITNLMAGDQLVGIDFRPENGLLYGLAKAGTGNTGRLYTINTGTAVATLVATLNPDTLDGVEFAVDFNPLTDRLQVISNSGQSLTVVPGTGGTSVATISGEITALAFTNGFKGTKRSTAYAVNSNADSLSVLTLPDDLAVIGALGVDVTTVNGFDIDATNSQALLVYNSGAQQPRLRTVNLTSGAAGGEVSIGVNENVRGVAVPTPNEPRLYAICKSENFPAANPNACTAGKTLLHFQASSPNIYTVVADVTGLVDSDETVLALAFRPSDGALYAVSSKNRLYTINIVTAAATLVGALSPDPALDLTKTYGMSFNPTTDTLRLVGSNDVNLEINAGTAAVTTHTPIQRIPFAITGLDNNGNLCASVANAATRTSFALDSLSDRLYCLDTDQTNFPGHLTLIGALGVDATALNGFDIVSGVAYAAWVVTPELRPRLFEINLGTGVGTNLGQIGTNNGFVGSFTGMTAAASNVMFAVKSGSPAFLYSFDPRNGAQANFILNGLEITGLAAGEEIVGIEFDTGPAPALFAVGSAGNLYTVNTTTGLATKRGAGLVDPSAAGNPLAGATAYGFGWEGTAFRITKDAQTSGNGTNLIVDRVTSAVTQDTDLYIDRDPVINAVAFTSNFVGATTTRMLVWNAHRTDATSRDFLMLQSPINQGVVTEVGGSAHFNSKDNGTSNAALNAIGGHDGLLLVTTRKQPNNNNTVDPEGFSTLINVDPANGASSDVSTVGKLSDNPNVQTDTRIVVQTTAMRFAP
jgi:hypothetical protein